MTFLIQDKPSGKFVQIGDGKTGQWTLTGYAEATTFTAKLSGTCFASFVPTLPPSVLGARPDGKDFGDAYTLVPVTPDPEVPQT